jgi:thiopurine S-methyltransferase
MRWQAGAITLWCGDFFSLGTEQLGQIDTVFDRAALTALPEDIRSGYVQLLRRIVTPQTEVFLLTVEDIDPDSDQAREPVDAELLQLYGSHFAIALTHAEVLDTPTAAAGLCAGSTAGTQALGKVYRLVPHDPG